VIIKINMTSKLSLEDSGKWICERINNAKGGLAMGKIGTNDCAAIIFYLRRLKTKEPYPEYIREALCVVCGLWEVEDCTLDESIDLWAKMFINALRDLDGIVMWNPLNPTEEEFLVNICCPNAQKIDLLSLEPYHVRDSEYSLLMNKSDIAVVSSFAKSIEKQWEKRDKIFPGHMWLPEQKLITIQAYYGPYMNRFGGLSYPEPLLSKGPIEAVKYYVDQVKATNAKYCFIGVGILAVPIAAELKKAGIIAIHTGGATQMMFGIKGGRWREQEVFQKMFNEYWVNPAPEEIPTEAKRVENSCFW